MREKELERLKDYKYGFTTDIETIKAPKGLNEKVIKFIKPSLKPMLLDVYETKSSIKKLNEHSTWVF